MTNNILIVEDEPVVANDVKLVLEKNGFDVVGIAKDFQNAIEIFNKSKIDLVLCDINLGSDKSGIMLAKELRNIKKEIPIVYVSAYSDEQTINDAFSSQPYSFITKPFTENQLIVTVKRLFANKRSDLLDDTKRPPTKRELEIIQCIAEGLTSHAIAIKLNISFETVQTHRKNILHKYKVNSSAGLIALSVKNGWIT